MNEFVSVLNSLNTCGKLPSPDFATQFVVSKFPVSGEDTSWEEIIEFGNDFKIKREYYALVKWVNEISRKNLPAAHIVYEYNPL